MCVRERERVREKETEQRERERDQEREREKGEVCVGGWGARKRHSERDGRNEGGRRREKARK